MAGSGSQQTLGFAVALALAVVVTLYYVSAIAGPDGDSGYAIAASIVLGALIIAFAIIANRK